MQAFVWPGPSIVELAGTKRTAGLNSKVLIRATGDSWLQIFSFLIVWQGLNVKRLPNPHTIP
jgi:hypothetical protein